MVKSLLDELFTNIREAAGPKVWSKGVEIARANSVLGESVTEEEAVLSVKDSSASVARRVHLAFLDGEWECDCRGQDDPCSHVAAAVIACRRAQESGQPLQQTSQSAAKILYRFVRKQEDLALQRVLLLEGKEEALKTSVSALASGRVAGPKVFADQLDLEIDRLLGAESVSIPPLAIIPQLFKFLEGLDSITFEGSATKVISEGLGLVLYVRNEGPGVLLKAERDPHIQEVFRNGIVLSQEGRFHPLRRPQLTSADQRLLQEGQIFGPRNFQELAGEILPRLSAYLRVIYETNRLPHAQSTRVFPALELKVHSDELYVTPRLVYGQQVIAKVVKGQLESVDGEIAIRDIDEERRLRDRMWQDLKLVLDETKTYSSVAAVKYVSEVLPALRQKAKNGRMELIVLGDGAKKFALYPELSVSLEIESHDFHLSFEVSEHSMRSANDGGYPYESSESEKKKIADPKAVMTAFARGDSFVSLRDGGYAPLPRDWLKRYGEYVRDLLDAKDASQSLPRACLPSLAALAEETGVEMAKDLRELREKLLGITPSLMKAPDGLDQILRDYQKAGVSWLTSLKDLGCGALLADDMGLGKTLQAISILSPQSLVVAPTSVVGNWVKELERFRPSLKVSVYHGPNRVFDPQADVVITSYALLRLDQEIISQKKWSVVILDEAQTIKNPDSQVARAAFKLLADFRLSLSGTPIENHLDDLWSQMRFANPGLLGTRSDFDERYGQKIAQGDQITAANLRQKIKPFFLRRLKSQVAKELPPRTDTLLMVELSGEERAIYDAVLAAARKEVVEKLDSGKNTLDALEALLRLRQACCASKLLPGAPGPDLSAKLEVLVEKLQIVSQEKHRALVFSQWTSLLDLLEPLLIKEGISYLRLDGSTRDREKVVREFQQENGPSCLIMSLKAGGVGLNLTAADHVFIVDPWWNPAVEDQAADRAHRIGQTRPVYVHKLVAQGTVEEKILVLQEHKRMLASLTEISSFEAHLTKDDLLALFS